MNKLVAELSQLAMWEDWQEIVRRSLPNFCASPIYVQQRSQSQEEFERAAEAVALISIHDPAGQIRDAEFGGLVRNTRALGPVTRMWLDTEVEMDFLLRHGMFLKRAIDIGAGYGRLAVALQPWAASMTCTDAVPISTELCTMYCARFAPDVEVLSLEEFITKPGQSAYNLAINVHSWNECSFAQVKRWLEVLRERAITDLFTVSNGHLSGGRSAYSTWGGRGESFRPLLEAQYDLIAEEEIGLSLHPHALWRLKL